ncbi:quaternary amine ABC transporter ATP-binding protein [Leeia oryzae]|uniref:quaternary amine ABC transporter ATP-binding protein n=1 Tax=Leeia oryzae TaxID=356662 RepID=UPI000374C526|nr:glycine betaine/L-proline ABC transporter ATP-binding protein [Leeia oryzae]
MQQSKIIVENLYKVFGPQPMDAVSLLKQGKKKEEIFEKTGQVVGVNNVSFEVGAGEIFVLMGLSGSGKSTLIRLINRLVDPTDGKIIIDGEDVAKLPPQKLVDLRRKDMSMVFQSFALMPHRTVIANAAFGLEVAGMPKKQREMQAMTVLEQVGLAAFAHKYPHQLSGGMQQRVGLARALAVNPSLMLMDEAFSALDPLKRSEMQDVLLKLQREHRRTIFFVSHDLEEALRIGTRIAIMEGGRLVQVGTPQEIVENPAEDYVRDFFKSVDTSRYLMAKDMLDSHAVPVFKQGETIESSRLNDYAWCVCLSKDNRFLGLLPTERAQASIGQSVSIDNLITVDSISHRSVLQDVLPKLLGQRTPLPVLDDDGHYTGVLSAYSVLTRISQRGLHV